MKRFGVFAAAAAAATVMAGILTASGGAQAPVERTFKVIEQSGGTFKLVDNPPKARNPRNPVLSAGDFFVFTTPLRSEANRPAGTVHAVCTVTRGGRFDRASTQCEGTFDLRDGTLAVSALIKRGKAIIAVVGGTGAYEGARGSITDRDLPGDRTEDTIHLLP